MTPGAGARSAEEPQTAKGAGPRTAARLAAVQALYQIELTGAPVDQVIEEFLSGARPEPDQEDDVVTGLPAPDPILFSAVVTGVTTNRERLDQRIAAALSAGWTVPRLEILVRLILEAGAFELIHLDDIPAKVSINEYVDVAKAFFDGAEPGLINGVLDAVAAEGRRAAEGDGV
ncbi:MAG: transcription antitermination factor NusB [Alphaproteobacteria bacterium]|nr:transcription antitermination factor NusB [Alphaproteobacteria bacterium]